MRGRIVGVIAQARVGCAENVMLRCQDGFIDDHVVLAHIHFPVKQPPVDAAVADFLCVVAEVCGAKHLRKRCAHLGNDGGNICASWIGAKTEIDVIRCAAGRVPEFDEGKPAHVHCVIFGSPAVGYCNRRRVERGR